VKAIKIDKAMSKKGYTTELATKKGRQVFQEK